MNARELASQSQAVFWVCLIVVFFAGRGLDGQDRQPIKPKPLAEFPIARFGDPLLLPVTLGEECCLFVLDSGATIHVFDSSLRHYLGRPVGITPAQSPVQGDFFREIGRAHV